MEGRELAPLTGKHLPTIGAIREATHGHTVGLGQEPVLSSLSWERLTRGFLPRLSDLGNAPLSGDSETRTLQARWNPGNCLLGGGHLRDT